MVLKTVEFSLRQRALVLLATLVLIGVGVWSALRLPIDAVPDITNPQVLVNTAVPALAPEEIEKLVTLPLESQMAGLPGMMELRSLSKFGLSQVTMIFQDDVDIYRTRQLVTERLQTVLDELRATLALPPPPKPNRQAVINRLAMLRGRLNRHAAAMRGAAGASGIPLHQVIGALVGLRRRGLAVPDFTLDAAAWDGATIAAKRDAVRDLAARASEVCPIRPQ